MLEAYHGCRNSGRDEIFAASEGCSVGLFCCDCFICLSIASYLYTQLKAARKSKQHML